MTFVTFVTLITFVTFAQEQLPRFRSGANLVTVDAYFAKDGSPVTDLTPEEIEILEDDRPQKIEHFRIIQPGGQGQAPTRSSPTTVNEARDAAADPAARLFVLFFDTLHVSFEGSARAAAPVSELLNRVVGNTDLVGMMTPDMRARDMSLTRRTTAIERAVRDVTTWGERGKMSAPDSRERDYEVCYPENDLKRPQFVGIAKEMIERRREQRTLEALDDLITHAGSLRDERKFVILFTEGWVLFQRNEALGRVLAEDSVPGATPLGVGSDGRITTTGRQTAGEDRSFQSCERDRVMLAFIDHGVELRRLAQRANRANITFYGIDPRGLAVFDDSIGPLRPASPEQDRERMSLRQSGLRELAQNTDGAVVLNTNDVRGGVARMMSDLGSYYLMSYYSSNAKLDGRFRRITVKVKRPGVEVRARAGYLAPTESELRAAGGGDKSGPPSTVTRALDAIAPARGALPVRVQAAAGRGTIRAIVELDAVTMKQPEWTAGGTARVTITPDKGAAIEPIIAAFDPGQRSMVLTGGTQLTPGRYTIRAEVTPAKGRIPVQMTTTVTVPADSAVTGTAALAWRRGPSTGLAYLPTADPRFRRTERLRVEVPLSLEGVKATGRVLTREGQALQLIISHSTRIDAGSATTFAVADVTLSALAAGEYVLELLFEAGGKTENVSYGFRIVP
jgi:VWFA-related protein